MAKDQDCGAKCSGSSLKLDPYIFFVKTSLLSELEALTGRSATWKESATPAGRSWWVLAMSERRTVGIECGSWPTADTFNRKSRKAMTASTENGRRTGGGNSSPPGLEQVAELVSGIMPHDLPENLPPGTRNMISALWPAATAGDANASGSQNLPGSNAHPGISLTDKERECWPTPNKCDGERGPESTAAKAHRPKAGGGNLAGKIMETWPTPAAQDAKNDTLPPSQMNRDTVPGAMLRDGPPGPASVNTNGKSPDCEWPTPVSTRDGRFQRTERAKMEKNVGRGVLNARWVLQLMGYPANWCDGGIETP